MQYTYWYSPVCGNGKAHHCSWDALQEHTSQKDIENRRRRTELKICLQIWIYYTAEYTLTAPAAQRK